MKEYEKLKIVKSGANTYTYYKEGNTLPSCWDTAKAVFIEKFIALVSDCSAIIGRVN